MVATTGFGMVQLLKRNLELIARCVWPKLHQQAKAHQMDLGTGTWRKPGASSYTRKRLSLTGAKAKAWCLRIHAEASLSHGGQGESLVPPYTRGSVSLSRGQRRKPGASSYTRKRLSLTGARAKAWCLLIHAEASPSIYEKGLVAGTWNILCSRFTQQWSRAYRTAQKRRHKHMSAPRHVNQTIDIGLMLTM